MFSWSGNEKSNVTRVTPKKALIGGVVRTGSQLPRSMEVVWKHTITFTQCEQRLLSGKAFPVSDTNDFVNAKSHAREKSLLEG